MSVCLGNVSVDEMEKRAGVKFPAELVIYINERRQQDAGPLEKDKWHCFDIPFSLACENMEMVKEIHKHLKPLSLSFKDPLQLSIQEK